MELKPCGHCPSGIKYLRIFEDDADNKVVECTMCGARAIFDDPDYGWNSRPLEDAARAEALEEAVKKIEWLMDHSNTTAAFHMDKDKLDTFSSGSKVALIAAKAALQALK